MINSDSYKKYTYDYAQNLTMTWHGFDIAVDPTKTYTWSFDAYISPDANIAGTGSTFIAQGEFGFPSSFSYDNAYKGTWQHFEFTGQPTSSMARLLLYPTMGSTPATTGHVAYRNVDFRKNGTATNLYPQPGSSGEFAEKGSGVIEVEPYASGMYKYDYAQQLRFTWHGFDIKVDPTQTYTWSFDAYISPDANLAGTGSTFIAQGELGFPSSFTYNNAQKGTWQRFEYTGQPTSNVARLLLYPTMGDLPATQGYLMFKNVEFKKAGSVYNLYPQPVSNEGFDFRSHGVFNSKMFRTYSYDFEQSLTGTWHGFDIEVDPTQMYTWSFDAYISPDANIAGTGNKFIAQGENGFPVSFYYDSSRKGTWQRFEYTAKPVSSNLRLLLYPTASGGESLVTSGFILYKNVQLKLTGLEWNEYIDIGSGLQYTYGPEGRSEKVEIVDRSAPLVKYEYDSNGNLIRKQIILP